VEAAKVSSTLLVPDGIYIFSGALQDTSRRNAQILLPAAAQTDPTYSVTIKGYHPLSNVPWPGTIATPKGPIFRSTLSTGGGTQPSFIGGMGPVGGIVSPDLSFITVCFENMIFQTHINPLISCLNLNRVSVAELKGDVIVMAGTSMSSDTAVQPTTATSYGVIIAANNSSFTNPINNLYIWNFYTGLRVGELVHIQNLGCLMCMYAMEIGFAYHAAVIEKIVDWWCANGIKMTESHTFQVEQYDVERGADGQWYSRVYDVDDGAHRAIADINWWTVKTVSGALNAFTINGGAHVKARRVGADLSDSPVYIGTDARLTAISGGVTLEVRNAGTGVWVEATRYTNP
jgi:hypothetical protein